MPCLVGALYGGRNGAALLVPKDHDQLRMEVFYRILDAGQFIVPRYVPRNPDDKQIAQPLIEYQFGWNSGIGTAQNDGKWMLNHLQLSAPGQSLIGVLLLVTRVACIPLHQPAKGLISRYCVVGLLSPDRRAGRYRQQPKANATPEHQEEDVDCKLADLLFLGSRCRSVARHRPGADREKGIVLD